MIISITVCMHVLNIIITLTTITITIANHKTPSSVWSSSSSLSSWSWWSWSSYHDHHDHHDHHHHYHNNHHQNNQLNETHVHISRHALLTCCANTVTPTWNAATHAFPVLKLHVQIRLLMPIHTEAETNWPPFCELFLAGVTKLQLTIVLF